MVQWTGRLNWVLLKFPMVMVLPYFLKLLWSPMFPKAKNYSGPEQPHISSSTFFKIQMHLSNICTYFPSLIRINTRYKKVGGGENLLFSPCPTQVRRCKTLSFLPDYGYSQSCVSHLSLTLPMSQLIYLNLGLKVLLVVSDSSGALSPFLDSTGNSIFFSKTNYTFSVMKLLLFGLSFEGSSGP